jgi:hypothetical protein
MRSRRRVSRVSMGWVLLAVALMTMLAVGPVQPAAAATQIDIVGPAGSGAFGSSVTVLPNGNIVVTDPYYDAGTTEDVGAVYLYDGATGALISVLTGSTAGDRVGFFGVQVLSNGNFVVRSPYWVNGGVADAGAVTWASGTTGVNGAVSAANSLVGSTAGDQVGMGDVVALSNGNYVVWSAPWHNAGAEYAGAVTWGNGTAGTVGVVSAANSLVGSAAYDYVGQVIALSNGNYLVLSEEWDNGSAAGAGAVTWGDGTGGTVGVVSEASSLVGSTAGDHIGSYSYGGVEELSNGNYLVWSSRWDNGPAADAGAVTWGDGNAGISGVVSAANSLVGSTAYDQVGGVFGPTMLSNGNYVVASPKWDNGAAADAGAVTWGSGTTGVSGVVSAANSLVGSTVGDGVGERGVTELTNGNYVVASPAWDNGAIGDAGAVTWANGTTSLAGPISAANSLVGSTAGDQVGYYWATALSNGNYVVRSPSWDNGGVSDAGAVTWGDGTSGTAGVVSASNSLVGSTAGDGVGYGSVTELSNGNYVVTSISWHSGGAAYAGAVTWCDGATGTVGVVSASNSLVGNTAADAVGADGVTALANGNYVVASSNWHNGAVDYAGAVTWGDGTTGIAGPVTAANSLVGSTSDDLVGYDGVTALSNGNYVVTSFTWHNGAAFHAGAVTWGDGTSGIVGPVSAANSLVGSTDWDEVGDVTVLSKGHYLVVSPDWDNGTEADAGAVTWGDGMSGIAGPVSAANSLVGNTAGDQVGSNGVALLSNGHYVVGSPHWHNGAIVDAGAATWGDGTTGIVGAVSEANSLVGSTEGDQVGLGHYSSDMWALSNGHYVVSSSYWDNGAIVDAGAMTWGDGTVGTTGPIAAENSVLGTAENGGESMRWAYDSVNQQLVVGRPADNIVTLFRLSPVYTVFLPVILKNGP